MERDALLELVGLLHPTGFARRSAVIGPGLPARAHDAAVDLALLIPSVAQWRDPRWRADALMTIGARLAPDGILFAVPPGRIQRRSMLAAVKHSGLSVVEPVALLPDLRRARHLTPLAPRPLEHELLRTAPRARPVAATAARVASSSRALELLLPAVGYVAQRRGARPPLGWLGPAYRPTPGAWLTRGSWRGPAGAAVVLGLEPRSSRVSLVAKVTGAVAAEEEAHALRTVAAGAALDRVRTPRLLRSVRLGDRSALVEEPLDGQPLAVRLARHPERLEGVLATLARWLQQWATATRQDAVLQPAELEASVLAPARKLTPMLENSQAYLDWLANLVQGVVGTRLARTAAHHDLTMWNVLVLPSGQLGILDWAQSAQRALPLGDLAYAVVDAVAAVERYRSRSDAFAACFAPGGRRPDGAACLRRLAARLDLSPDAQALCFHACWLAHAVNELRHDHGRAGPFVAIVRRLAAEPSALGLGAER